jgi:hypothetical protein
MGFSSLKPASKSVGDPDDTLYHPSVKFLEIIDYFYGDGCRLVPLYSAGRHSQ